MPRSCLEHEGPRDQREDPGRLQAADRVLRADGQGLPAQRLPAGLAVPNARRATWWDDGPEPCAQPNGRLVRLRSRHADALCLPPEGPMEIILIEPSANDRKLMERRAQMREDVMKGGFGESPLLAVMDDLGIHGMAMDFVTETFMGTVVYPGADRADTVVREE